MKIGLALLICLVVLPQYIPALSHAQGVYKWEENGKVHYSSKPPAKDAKPVQLPPIMRGEVKLAKQTLVTCDKHGGVDCQAGIDTDGSVICLDGFRESSARFRFTCSSPKLEITQISDLTENLTYVVSVRNSKSVEAKKPQMSLKIENGRPIKLKGPETIEPFGIAEFELDASDKRLSVGKPSFEMLDLTCSNCG